MQRFLKKAPQILLKTVTGQELSQGQKEVMREIRGSGNNTPAPSPQEIEVLRQPNQRADTVNAETARLQAEAADLQVQLDAANARASSAQEAKRVAELKAQLAQIQQAEQGAAAAGAESFKQLEHNKAAQLQEEDDPVLAVAIAESQYSASQVSAASAAAAAAPPSYEEIEAINASALEEGIRASQEEARQASTASSENMRFAEERTKEQDEDLVAGIQSSLSEVTTEQCRALVNKFLTHNVLPQNVKLTQQQYDELQRFLFQEYKFQKPDSTDGSVVGLQSLADDWLNKIEPNIVASEDDSNLSSLTGLSAHLE